MKKKIIFAVDCKNWAYHNIAKSYSEYLTDYEVYYYITKDYEIKNRKFNRFQFIFINSLNFIRLYLYKFFSISKKIFFVDSSLNFSYPVFSKDKIYDIKSDCLVSIKSVDYIWEMAYYFQYTSVIPKISFKKRFIGIYTDSFPHEGPNKDLKKNKSTDSLSIESFYKEYIKHYDGLIVGSNNLLQKYRSITDKVIFSNSILGQEKFIENKKIGEENGLCIGWTGNPNREMKNFYSIIKPCIEQLQKKGLNIQLKTKFSGSYEELYSFYTDVDLVIIASDADTGPSLFAEASLSKVPAVSTRIGFPKMIIQNNINGIIVEKNTIEGFTTAIEKLYYNRELLKNFSARIKEDYLIQIDNHTMANQLVKFIENN